MATLRNFAASLKALNEPQLYIIAQNLVNIRKGALTRKYHILIEVLAVCRPSSTPSSVGLLLISEQLDLGPNRRRDCLGI